jgi:hypothetical protein
MKIRRDRRNRSQLISPARSGRRRANDARTIQRIQQQQQAAANPAIRDPIDTINDAAGSTAGTATGGTSSGGGVMGTGAVVAVP